MKRIILLFFITMIISACSTSNEGTGTEPDESSDQASTEEKEDFLDTKEKEEIPKKEIKKDALYTFKAEQDDTKYNVYFYAENEKEDSLEEDSFQGDKGDKILSGDYSFYLAEKDSDTAYKQTQIDPIPYEVNKKNDLDDQTSLQNGELFTVFKREASDAHTPFVYTFKDGELKEVKSEELGDLFSPHLKAVDEDKIQSVRYSDTDDPSWEFHTFVFKDDNLMLESLGKTTYSDTEKADYPLEAGKERYDIWANSEEAFVPYKESDKKWELPESIKETGEKGEFEGIPITLGDNLYPAYKEHPQITFEYWMNDRWFEVERFIKFADYAVGYIPNFSPEKEAPAKPKKRYQGEITSIKIPADKSKETMDSVKEQLGKPDEEGEIYEEREDAETIRYFLNDTFMLEFSEEQGSDNVSIILRERNY